MYFFYRKMSVLLLRTCSVIQYVSSKAQLVIQPEPQVFIRGNSFNECRIKSSDMYFSWTVSFLEKSIHFVLAGFNSNSTSSNVCCREPKSAFKLPGLQRAMVYIKHCGPGWMNCTVCNFFTKCVNKEMWA